MLAAQLDSMRRWVDFAATAAASGRHPTRVDRNAQPLPHERFIWDSGWHFGEWLEPGTNMDEVFADLFVADHGPVATAYLFRSADQLGRIGQILGDADVAEHYGTLAANVLDAWHVEFLDEHGRVQPGPRPTWSAPSPSGSSPTTSAPQPAPTWSRSSAPPAPTSAPASCPPRSSPVLADTGHTDVAFELLLRDDEPSCGSA